MFARREDIRGGTQTSCSSARCPLPACVSHVITFARWSTTQVMCFFVQILNIWIQEVIYNAQICMIKKKEKGFVTLCRYKWVRPAHKHQLPHMSETWCGMKTQIAFNTLLLGKCPISSEMWKNSEDFYSRRGAIRSATHASFTNVRCPLPKSVLFVIGKRATSNNVFHALFLLKS